MMAKGGRGVVGVVGNDMIGIHFPNESLIALKAGYNGLVAFGTQPNT